MSQPSAVDPGAAAGPQPPGPAEYGIAPRADGVYLDTTMASPTLMATVDNIFLANNFFAGLDYKLLVRALYGVGPELPKQAAGEAWLRFASGIVPFEPVRRDLYRAVKISDGQADYYFEPVYLHDPGNPLGQGIPAKLDIDEFIADMWLKGIRFGIDVDAVRAAIATGAAGRVVVARRLDVTPGEDAGVLEVSDDIHRSDAPRRLANGRLDLQAFQNRFPQIRKDVRLLKKIPRVPGKPGWDLSGIVIEPAIPADFDLESYCGLGTAVERTGEGEFLVSQQAGFLMVDPKTSQISIGQKIVSHDGVSVRTTGNLLLTGDFEEFGEVQEKRVIEGEGIVVHADVFGKVVSRGGTIALNSNLVGGTALNKRGDIVVRGVASAAIVQASNGKVMLQRAENCVISGTSVCIEHAANCEIIGDEVTIGLAEGCAVAGRVVTIDSAGPRRQSEMVVFAQVADSARIDDVIAQTRERVAQLGELAARHKAEMDRIASQPEVQKYMRIATGVRKNEITLSPEQVPQFQKMALAVGPSLKEVGKAQLAMKAAQDEQQTGLALVAQLEQQRDSAGASRVLIKALQGETQVRILKFNPDGSSTYDLPPRDIRQRLRSHAGARLFSGAAGTFDWNSERDL